MYEITSYYTDLEEYYPYLSGLAVLLPQSLFTLVQGVWADKFNRVYILGGCSLAWSSITLVSADINNFQLFCALRVLFGCVASTGPAASGIIRDNFGPSKRATANSIFSSAGFLGGGIASLSILLIEKYGWQVDYEVVGITGIILGILLLTLIKEPERGQFDI